MNQPIKKGLVFCGFTHFLAGPITHFLAEFPVSLPVFACKMPILSALYPLFGAIAPRQTHNSPLITRCLIRFFPKLSSREGSSKYYILPLQARKNAALSPKSSSEAKSVTHTGTTKSSTGTLSILWAGRKSAPARCPVAQ